MKRIKALHGSEPAGASVPGKEDTGQAVGVRSRRYVAGDMYRKSVNKIRKKKSDQKLAQGDMGNKNKHQHKTV